MSYRVVDLGTAGAVRRRARAPAAAAWLGATFLAGCGDPALPGPVDGQRAFAHLEKLVGIGPRPPGSKALRDAGDYVLAELRKLGLKPHEQVWVDQKEKIEFRNLWVQIDGEDPAGGPILGIGAHYDTKITHGHDDPAHNIEFVGAIDGGGGPAVLLELARVLVTRQNRTNIWLIWFDGEESLEWDWNDERALFGSRYFVATMAEDKERFPRGFSGRFKSFVLLDLIGDKDIKFDRDITSDGQINDIFLRTAEAMGQGHRMFRWELSKDFKDDHLPFRNRGVVVATLIDFQWRIPDYRDPARDPAEVRHLQAWWHTADDTLDKVSPWALQFTGALVWNALPKLEDEVLARFHK